MMKNLKMFGLALAAVFAMSAVVASAASAAEEFHGPSGTTTLTGSQVGNDVLTTMGGTMTCTTITYAGAVVGPTSTEASGAPTFSGCTSFGFVNVPIDVN